MGAPRRPVAGAGETRAPLQECGRKWPPTPPTSGNQKFTTRLEKTARSLVVAACGCLAAWLLKLVNSIVYDYCRRAQELSAASSSGPNKPPSRPRLQNAAQSSRAAPLERFIVLRLVTNNKLRAPLRAGQLSRPLTGRGPMALAKVVRWRQSDVRARLRQAGITSGRVVGERTWTTRARAMVGKQALQMCCAASGEALQLLTERALELFEQWPKICPMNFSPTPNSPTIRRASLQCLCAREESTIWALCARPKVASRKLAGDLS